MFVHARQSTTSRKKATFRQPPCQDLVESYQTVSSERTAADPLDKVRTQAYRDACRAAYFGVEKVYKTEESIQELDKKLTGGQIGVMTASTGGVKISWNKRPTATAGLARCKRGTLPSATIELSDKLIDDQERLLNTVAHEFCHVANILINGDLRSHGSGFKKWGNACEEAFSDIGIKVTRTHNYRPKFEFIWTCSEKECGKEIGHHSKRLDPKKDRCRHCGGVLMQTNPVARVLKSRREWDIWE
jgi:predicted SprT family Zn-dependent metalloprotease